MPDASTLKPPLDRPRPSSRRPSEPTHGEAGLARLQDRRTPPAGNPARLPSPRRILSWLYVGRVALAAAIFAAVVGVWRDIGPATTLAASLTLFVSAAFAAGSFWYTHVRETTPGRSFLYGQLTFDALLVTWVIHLTGGQQSTFAPFYILVVCAAAVLLPFAGGVLIGLLASTLYLADIVLVSRDFPGAGAFLQTGLVAAVALITSFLGDRLRQAGAALGEVETALRLLRLDTNDILGGISTGILTVDGTGRLIYMNPAAVELLGLPPQQWLGQPVLPVLDRLAPGLGSVIARSAETRMPIRRFETGEIPESPLILGVSTTLMERSSEGVPPVTAIFQDITERKRIDMLRRRTERLEAIAELSASLAHEIKNPLASIRSAVEQLGGADVDAEDQRSLERLVLRESDRLSRLLAEFIDFARVQVAAPQSVNLGAVLHGVMDLVRAHPDAVGRALEVAPIPPSQRLLVRGDEDLLHRAVFNLVLNAAQWAGEGGRVRVALDSVRSDILSPALGAADVVRLTVADTGPGVPPELTEQIFDPFFTCRPGGTGLGLALVQRAVDAHGGAIVVENSRSPDENGCTFFLYLPTLTATPARLADAPPGKEALA